MHRLMAQNSSKHIKHCAEGWYLCTANNWSKNETKTKQQHKKQNKRKRKQRVVLMVELSLICTTSIHGRTFPPVLFGSVGREGKTISPSPIPIVLDLWFSAVKIVYLAIDKSISHLDFNLETSG